MVKRLLYIFVCFWAAAVLSGCMKFETNIENLIKAPRLTAEQTDIHEALQKAIGISDIDFKYPKSGKYRSAFVMYDIDCDDVEEALVFYSDPHEESDNVRISLLDYTGNTWRPVFDISGPATEIDTVEFCKFTPDKGAYIVIGWSVASSRENMVVVYSYENERLNSVYSDGYRVMLIEDIDHDELDEMILLGRTRAVKAGTARLVADDDGTIQTIDSSSVNYYIDDYKKVSFGRVYGDAVGIFADGSTDDGMLVSDVFVLGPDSIDSLMVLYDYEPLTLRSSQYCSDINEDGIIDIPMQQSLYGYEEGLAEENVYMTSYYNFNESGDLIRTYASIINEQAGYMLKMPDSWEEIDNITVTKVNGEWIYSVYIPETDSFEEVLRILAHNVKDPFDKLEYENYFEIASRGPFKYYAALPKEKEADGYSLEAEMVDEMFNFI